MWRFTWQKEKKRETLSVYNFLRRCDANFRADVLAKMNASPIPRYCPYGGPPGQVATTAVYDFPRSLTVKQGQVCPNEVGDTEVAASNETVLQMDAVNNTVAFQIHGTNARRS